MNKIADRFVSIEQVQDEFLKVRNGREEAEGNGISFQAILSEKVNPTENLKFSRHASERLERRSIELTEQIAERLSEGVKRAGEKGIKDSLVVVDSYAFIVNVPNRTVVTAMDQGETEDHIFTNIDGAVIA